MGPILESSWKLFDNKKDLFKWLIVLKGLLFHTRAAFPNRDN